MKLTGGKKTAMICFAVFLAFMAVCTVVSKGIYASGLPQVVTVKPYSGSFTHEIAVSGTVVQGQEYGVYVEAGLRVDTVSVGRGDVFREGDALFRIETGDLADIVAKRRLETAKLEARMSEAIEEDSRERQSQRRAAERAREDYEREVVLADARIWECQQALEEAGKALALYEQYLEDSGKAAGGGNGGEAGADGDGSAVPDGDGSGNVGADDIGSESTVPDDVAGGGGVDGTVSGTPVPEAAGAAAPGGLQEVSGEGFDPAQQYSRQEKRLLLEQNVITAAQALEEAVRQKEDRLRNAARAAEDAAAAVQTVNAEVNTLALEAAYQKENLQKLEKLLEAEGWVYAEASGLVTDSRLKVGERTQDGASLIYAMDDGERVVSAVFGGEDAAYISADVRFAITAQMPDGSKAEGTALVEYLEKGSDNTLYARLSFDLPGLSIGQPVKLSYKMQTDMFSLCVARSCVHQEVESRSYVYVAEEQEGILGTEWKVREVEVRILDQSDTASAIQSMEITKDTRVVSGANKPLADGAVVRVVR